MEEKQKEERAELEPERGGLEASSSSSQKPLAPWQAHKQKTETQKKPVAPWKVDKPTQEDKSKETWDWSKGRKEPGEREKFEEPEWAEKKFSCDHCSKSFEDKDRLKRHWLSKSGEEDHPEYTWVYEEGEREGAGRKKKKSKISGGITTKAHRGEGGS